MLSTAWRIPYTDIDFVARKMKSQFGSQLVEVSMGLDHCVSPLCGRYVPAI